MLELPAGGRLLSPAVAWVVRDKSGWQGSADEQKHAHRLRSVRCPVTRRAGTPATEVPSGSSASDAAFDEPALSALG